MEWLSRIAIGLLSVGYPLAVYFTLQHGGTGAATWLLFPIGLLHTYRAIRGRRSGWWWLLGCLLLTAWSWEQQSSIGVKFYPVLVSVGLLSVFAWSLRFPPPSLSALPDSKNQTCHLLVLLIRVTSPGSGVVFLWSMAQSPPAQFTLETGSGQFTTALSVIC